MDFSKRIFAFIFEATHGCAHTCSGCTVNKTASSLPDKRGFEKISLFLDDLIANDTELNEFELAPTDILSAMNRNEFFESEDAIALLNRFRIFTINASLVRANTQDYIVLANQINATGYGSEKEIQVVTPIEFNLIHRPKYMDLLKRNLDTFARGVNDRLKEVNLVVNFDNRYLTGRDLNSPSITEQFEFIHNVDMGVNTKINFVFPHGRRPKDTMFLKDDMFDSILSVNRLYAERYKRKGRSKTINDVPYQFYCDGGGGEGTWFQNELYVRPLINERVTMFTENNRLKGEWTFNNFAAFAQELTNHYIERGLNMKNCHNCKSLQLCAPRGVQEVMDWMDTEECIMLLRDYDHLGVPYAGSNHTQIKWADKD